MKRKRNARDREPSVKRQKVELDPRSPVEVLKQYYPRVTTLRTYLASRLPKSARKRRKKLLYCASEHPQDASTCADPALAELLDTMIVGSFEPGSLRHHGDIDKDISVFTQQLSDTSTATTLTQGTPKQAEVSDQTSLCH